MRMGLIEKKFVKKKSNMFIVLPYKKKKKCNENFNSIGDFKTDILKPFSHA